MTSPPLQSKSKLILASTSRYRRELLERLHVPFECIAPLVDETPHKGESPERSAIRLSLEKAQAVHTLHPTAIVIGSDQVCDLHGTPLGKPGNFENAMHQLQAMRGQSLTFHTAVSVVAANFSRTLNVPVRVTMRRYSDAQIEHYLRTEEPYDCAGSAKSEALGIALCDRIESDDPTALIGLPLIATCSLLAEAGLDVLNAYE
jgi:septum formation protein